MFGGGLGCAFQLLLIFAAALLHAHDLFVSVEEDVENACELAAIEQICEGRTFRTEYTRAETNTHVVVIHLILVLTGNHLQLKETQ